MSQQRKGTIINATSRQQETEMIRALDEVVNLLREKFSRGSFYFRPEMWTVAEMSTITGDIAKRSILYHSSKYGEGHFMGEH